MMMKKEKRGEKKTPNYLKRKKNFFIYVSPFGDVLMRRRTMLEEAANKARK